MFSFSNFNFRGPLVYQFYYCYMLPSLNKVLLTYLLTYVLTTCAPCLLVISNSFNKFEYVTYNKEESIRVLFSINKLCSFNYFIIFFRIISQRKASFIVTLQLVIFWLAVITESKCQTLD